MEVVPDSPPYRGAASQEEEGEEEEDEEEEMHQDEGSRVRVRVRVMVRVRLENQCKCCECYQLATSLRLSELYPCPTQSLKVPRGGKQCVKRGAAHWVGQGT